MYGMAYNHNPLLHNPLLMMLMGMQNQPINPFEGNGLLHPVYITPVMMHQLEQSVPATKDLALDNAKQGNLDCEQGATVSCMESEKEIKEYTADGKTIISKPTIPEKISCFAGCAGMKYIHNQC